MSRLFIASLALVAGLAACGGGGGGTPAAPVQPSVMPSGVPTTSAASTCTGSVHESAAPGMTPTAPPLTVASGLQVETIAKVQGARELVALPNGDLLVGTLGNTVYIVPNADGSGAADAPQVFASAPPPAAGVTFSAGSCTVFVASEYHIYSTPYRDGDLQAENLQSIANVRTGPTANPGDGDVHTTTSIAVSGSTLYASMGSSCNACTGETDPQRAAIWQMTTSGGSMTLLAKHIRNAIALAVDPATGHLWAGGAGQDNLATYHPYEYMDDVTAAAAAAGGVADYGWPYCEENHQLVRTGTGAPANCDAEAVPLVEFPAYITHIGAVFYPQSPSGAYALAPSYRGALLVTSHGSWHQPGGCYVAPEVDTVAMNGDTPAVAMTAWGANDPTAQFTPLLSGFQPTCTTRIGRPTGIAVGPQGSIFVADDAAGAIYRIRPAK